MTPQIKQRIEQIRRGEVPEGYKKTKVGIVPSEWIESSLGIYLQEHKKLSNEIGKYPVYSSSRQGLIPQSQYYDNREAVETNLGYKIVPNGYVTYRHMSDDDIFHFNVNGTGSEILVSSEYPVFTSTSKGVLGYIIPMLNNSARFRYFCRTQKMGGTRTRLYYKNLCTYKAAFPTNPEQEKIAEILSAQDKLIALKEKLIEEKKRQKKVLMQQLLTGQKRIKGFADKWKKHKLDEFIVEYNEKTTINNQYPVLTSSRQGLFFQSEYYNKEIASEDNTGYNVVPRGYFTYRHMSDDEIFKFNINTIVDKGIVSTLYPVFTTKNIDDKYLQFLLNEGIEFKKFAMLQKQGGSRTYMYLDKLKQLRVLIPSIEEQTAISSIISTSEKEIEILQKDLNQEKQKKKALMQLLLTGIVRV